MNERYNFDDEYALACNYRNGTDKKGREKLITNHYYQLDDALQNLKENCKEKNIDIYSEGQSDEDFIGELSIYLIKGVDVFIDKCESNGYTEEKNRHLSGIVSRCLSAGVKITTRKLSKQIKTIEYCEKNEKEISVCGAVNEDDVEHSAFKALERELVASVLKETFPTIEENRRKLMYLRFYEDLTYNEIGRIMKSTPETLRQKVLNMLRKLRHPKHSYTLRDYYFRDECR